MNPYANLVYSRLWDGSMIAMAAFSQAFTVWLDDDPGDLNVRLAEAFREAHTLTS